MFKLSQKKRNQSKDWEKTWCFTILYLSYSSEQPNIFLIHPNLGLFILPEFYFSFKFINFNSIFRNEQWQHWTKVRISACFRTKVIWKTVQLKWTCSRSCDDGIDVSDWLHVINLDKHWLQSLSATFNSLDSSCTLTTMPCCTLDVFTLTYWFLSTFDVSPQ